MNALPTRAEVSEFVKSYHKVAITPEIDAASQSTIRIILMLLTETDVIPKDKLDAFMKKASEIYAIKQKMDEGSDTPADKPE